MSRLGPKNFWAPQNPKVPGNNYREMDIRFGELFEFVVRPLDFVEHAPTTPVCTCVRVYCEYVNLNCILFTPSMYSV